MNIIEKIFKKKENNLNKLQKRVETVQSVIDETDAPREIAHQKAVEVAFEQISKDPEMNIGKFAQMLIGDSSLTSDDMKNLIIKIAENHSENAAIAAVQSTSLPPEAITEIVAEAPISLDTAEKMVSEINDETIKRKEQEKIDTERENNILDRLSTIYETCDSIEDNNLAMIINQLQIQEYTPKMNKKLMDIISKRTALDCMKYGTPRFPTLTSIVPSIDMFEADLPFLALTEYKRLKVKFDNEEKSYYEFTTSTKDLIHERILEDIAKKSAQTFSAIGDFALPQTEKFKKLNNEDIKFFVNAVKIYCPGLSKSATKRLTRQLNGEAATELHDLNRMLEKMNPQDRDAAVQNIVALLRANALDGQKYSSNKQLDKILDDIRLRIKSLPIENQLTVAKSILNALDQRQEALMLFKRTSKNDTHSHPSGDPR